MIEKDTYAWLKTEQVMARAYPNFVQAPDGRSRALLLLVLRSSDAHMKLYILDFLVF